ncbi:MAG: hypothetical protein NTW87_12135, partial [Planctomycetota bacterium]|nr:hypothetical protein [Planctomycetota bacterium]
GAGRCEPRTNELVRGENLVYNGDFELASPASPPPGWTMWGAQKYKDPTNFTRETANPHAGQACLRIHHPAGTAGYVVSTPDHAIAARQGMRYTVTFWARAEKPGGAIFGFDAYEQLKPFVGAPSPGFFPVAVDREWKPHTFEVHEGWDFMARRTRWLLLVFKATPDEKEEQTLYLDDVTVAEAPSPREGRLLEREDLQVAPLEHRLAKGDQLAFTVDAAKRVRRATREAGGISFHRVAGWSGVPYSKAGDYVLAPELEQAIRDLRLPMTRFYAVGAEQFPLESAIEKAAELCRRVGVPLEKVVLEFETQGATSVLAPEVWARGVKHAMDKGLAFRRWEITNEPYVSSAKACFPTPDAYVAHFKAVSEAVRRAQPDGQIGLSIHGGDTAWGNLLLKLAAGNYDFVVPHYYCFVDVNKSSFEDVVLRGNAERLDDVLLVNALLRAYNPGRDVYQYDTEWGMHSGGPGGERADAVVRNSNVVGALHRAVRLIYYTREDLLRGASSWEMFTRVRSPGFGVLSPEAPDKRFLVYWLYYHFNRHVGEWVLDMQGTAPYYEWTAAGTTRSMPLSPVLATQSADGKSVYLVIVNGSWTSAAPCSVSLRGFRPLSAKGVVLSQASLDAQPLIAREADAVAELPVTLEDPGLRCVVPPHAVVFITVSGEPAAER